MHPSNRPIRARPARSRAPAGLALRSLGLLSGALLLVGFTPQEPADCVEAPTSACLTDLSVSELRAALADPSFDATNGVLLEVIASQQARTGDLAGAVETAAVMGERSRPDFEGASMFDFAAGRMWYFVRDTLARYDLADVDVTPIRDAAVALLDSAGTLPPSTRPLLMRAHASATLARLGALEEAGRGLDAAVEQARAMEREGGCIPMPNNANCANAGVTGMVIEALVEAALTLGDPARRQAALSLTPRDNAIIAAVALQTAQAGDTMNARYFANRLEGPDLVYAEAAIRMAAARAGDVTPLVRYVEALDPAAEAADPRMSRERLRSWIVARLSSAGHIETAWRFIEASEVGAQEPQLVSSVLLELIRTGDLDRAEAILGEVDWEPDPLVRLELAGANARRGRAEAARVYLRALEELAAEEQQDAGGMSVQLLARRAFMLDALGDEIEAAAVADRMRDEACVFDDPGSMEGFFVGVYCAAAFRQLGRDAEAEEVLDVTGEGFAPEDRVYARFVAAEVAADLGAGDAARAFVEDGLSALAASGIDAPDRRASFYVMAAEALGVVGN